MLTQNKILKKIIINTCNMKKKLLFTLVAFFATTIVFAQHERLFTRSDVPLDTNTFDFLQFLMLAFSTWCSYAINVKKGFYYLGYLGFPITLAIFYTVCPYDTKFLVTLLFPLVLGCLIGYVFYKLFFVKSKT
jgi:hypothetical protein